VPHSDYPQGFTF